MAYSDLLRDPRWQRKRLEVMQRDDFTCLECGDKATTLNVHHTYYTKGKKPWEYPLESLRTLCEPCHERVTGNLTEIQRLAGALDSGSLAIALGYLRGLNFPPEWADWAQCNDATPAIPFSSYEEMIGLAAALRVTESELHEAQTEHGTLTWDGYRSILEKRDPGPEWAR